MVLEVNENKTFYNNYKNCILYITHQLKLFNI